jgi:hypothetical protein
VSAPSNKPLVFAKFLDQSILSEMGRLLFSVLNTFALSGYDVQLFNNVDIDKKDEKRPYLRSVRTIPNLTTVDEIPKDTTDVIYLFDKKDSECAGKKWKKQIQVGFDVFSSHLFSSLKGVFPIMMPYPMHPLHYGPDLQNRLESARNMQRKSRIFFSGDTENYKRNRIRYPAPKLTRIQVVDTIMERLGDNVLEISDADKFNTLMEGEYVNKCVMLDNTKFRVEADSWLESISIGDFFLCPPGYVMPMCHNVIEAMAVGTIPIINYPEWLNPNLEDGVNCIAFNDEDDLEAKIIRALGMRQEEIKEMKSNVIEYYKRHLDPQGFISKLDSIDKDKIQILMITDGCVAKDPTRLSKHSILITGSARRLI